jgi:hypothetical protein
MENIKHNRSLKVAVSGLDFMAQPLYTHTWRLRIEMMEAKALRTFIRIYFLFTSEPLNTNIKLTLNKALFISIV